jgi:hypothetical protein
MPKTRRAPQQPNATPTCVVNELLALSVTEPSMGCCQYADPLADRGYAIAKSTVQRILSDHGLGRSHQRVVRSAAVTVAATGLLTKDAEAELFGFCPFAAYPDDLVALDSFYIGNLKGVGPVYQLTAIDTATRWATVIIMLGRHTAALTIRFLHPVIHRFRRLGVGVRAVLTDNGPEYAASALSAAVAATRSAHGSSTTTPDGATTATSCEGAHPPQSSPFTATARPPDMINRATVTIACVTRPPARNA